VLAFWALPGAVISARENTRPAAPDCLATGRCGDARDRAGHGNHGIVRGAGPAEGRFDGRGSFIEVPPSGSLNLAQSDFSMGSCTSSHLDAPADFRGTVFAMQGGQCVSHDRDLGPGWKHLAAVRRGERLELYFNGSRKAESAGLDQAAFDLSTNAPLRIGAGETDSFSGRIREVRLYRGALSAREIRCLAEPHHLPESASPTP